MSTARGVFLFHEQALCTHCGARSRWVNGCTVYGYVLTYWQWWMRFQKAHRHE